MRILVTGHLGYVGTVLVPRLLGQGHAVTGLDTELYRDCTYDGDVVQPPNIHKDIRDATVSDFDGFDAVIHLAGLSNDPLGSLDPRYTMQINHEATAGLAELARDAGVPRFVFASSCSVYGAGSEDWLHESSGCNPLTPYGESKLLAERDLCELAGDSFSPVMLRMATAYGLSPRIRFDLVVNNLTAWAHATGKILLKSDGTAWRPLVHVQDIAAALTAAATAPRDDVHNRILNIGQTSENYRIRDLADVVAEVSGCEIEMADGAVADRRCYRVNCDQASASLPGFEPTWSARQGIEELLAAYRGKGLTVDEFEGKRYQRLAHLQSLMQTGIVDATLRRVR